MPALSRRVFLKAGAVSVAFPLLDVLPASARGEDASASPQRLVIVQRPLGTYAPFFFPETTGPNYEPTRLLKLIDAHRNRFTVFSGMSHPGYPNNHGSEFGLLTAAPPEAFARWDDLHNTISLDQQVAQHVGRHTRIPYLLLGHMSTGLSFSSGGVPLPGDTNRAAVFARLFLDGSPAEVAREVRRLQDGRSILDGMCDQLAALDRRITPADRERLDVLTGTIREAEAALVQEEAWAAKPKPKIEYHVGGDASEWVGRTRQWYDLIQLALQTDSTRVIVYRLGEHSPAETVPGITLGEHDASHHGQDENKIEQVGLFEEAHLKSFDYLLQKLTNTPEQQGTLLDQTQLLFVSNLGDASAHSPKNLPVLLAGGGFRHQGHVAFDREQNQPLGNLYVRMLQKLGVETDRFGTSTSALDFA